MAATATITACSRAGHLDLVCELGLKLYDFAALVPIVEGAGGRMCDWNGDPLTAASEGHVLAIGDPGADGRGAGGAEGDSARALRP